MENGSQQLEIRILQGGGRARLSLRGELDLASAAVLMQELSAVNGSDVTEVVIDLAELSYIDPPGLSVLAVEKRRADASGQALRITSPTAFVRQMFDITGLDEVLEVLELLVDGESDGVEVEIADAGNAAAG